MTDHISPDEEWGSLPDDLKQVLSACRSELNGAVLRSALDNPHSTLDFLRNKFKDVQG